MKPGGVKVRANVRGAAMQGRSTEQEAQPLGSRGHGGSKKNHGDCVVGYVHVKTLWGTPEPHLTYANRTLKKIG